MKTVTSSKSKKRFPSQVKIAITVCCGTFLATALIAYLCILALNWWSEKTMSFENTDVKLLTSENFERFMENADRDVLVTFYAPWCPFCRRLKPELIKFASNVKFLLTCAAIDVSRYQEIGVKYHIEGLPTIMLFRKGESQLLFSVTTVGTLLVYQPLSKNTWEVNQVNEWFVVCCCR
eukprot:jgi/Galph1/1921/GphlegSOOS_G625.1